MAEFLASARWTRSHSKASDLQFFYDTVFSITEQ